MKKEAEIARHHNHQATTTYVGLFVEKGKIVNPSTDFYLVRIYVDGGTERAYLQRIEVLRYLRS
jgi:hypothetical protein